MEEHFDLRNAKRAFYFVFRLYNFVNLAIEDSNLREPLRNLAKLSSAIQEMNLPLLTGNCKTREDEDDDDDMGNGSPIESDIVSDEAILAALKRAGYTIPDKVEGFELLLPVRVSFPRKSQRLTLPLS